MGDVKTKTLKMASEKHQTASQILS